MTKKVIIITLVIVILALLCVFAYFQYQKYSYPCRYSEYVEKYSSEYSVPKELIYSVIRTESGFDEKALSKAGAEGLMQLMPSTVEWLCRLMEIEEKQYDLKDPDVNIMFGTYYLKHLYDRFGSWDTAIAAYNAGHGRVKGWLADTRYSDDSVHLKDIPIEETKNYVSKVLKAWDKYKSIYGDSKKGQ